MMALLTPIPTAGRWLVGLSLFLLAACGFQPMYGESQKAALDGGIRVVTSYDPVLNANGRALRAALEDRFNPHGVPAQPAYELAVLFSSAAGGIGVARDGTISRFNVTLGSSYTLKQLSDGAVVDSGVINHVGSYNNQQNQYFTTFISEKDAVRRGVEELAELYRQRIGLFLLKGVSS